MTNVSSDATEHLAYTTEDYKKYVFAQAQERLWRLREMLDAVQLDDEDQQDIHYQLAALTDLVKRTAFVDAGQAIATEKREKIRTEELQAAAAARRAEYKAMSR